MGAAALAVLRHPAALTSNVDHSRRPHACLIDLCAAVPNQGIFAGTGLAPSALTPGACPGTTEQSSACVRRLGENAAPSAHIRAVRASGRASCFILRAPERSGHPGWRHVRLRCRWRHRLMPTRSASPAVSGRRADFSGDQRQAAASNDTARPATRMSERCRSPQRRSRRRVRPSATRSGCNGAGRSSRRTVTASRATTTPLGDANSASSSDGYAFARSRCRRAAPVQRAMLLDFAVL